MTRKKVVTLLLVFFVGLPAAVAVVIACLPSVMPPQCAKTSFLGKTAASTVVLPPGGGGFTTLIGLLPFVSWDAGNAACAMPSASEVALTLVCTPVGGGAAFTLGPVTFPLGAPGGPGAQPVAGGGVAFPIPAGTPPATCLVTGTYDVDFTGGVGAMRLSAAGDLEVCLVEPSSIDPTLPRLDLQILDVGQEGLAQFAAHQGDQGQLFVLVANNSDETAQVSLESEGKQIAGFPVGFNSEVDAYANGVYRISDPNGDVFPTAIITDGGPLPIDRVPGAPGDRGTRPLAMTYTLGPGVVDVFGLNTNSFGACADGSCNERNLCVRGLFANGGPPHVAKACTQYTHRVDNSLRPRYPGLTIDVESKAHPQVDAQWTNTSFLDGKGDLIDMTHEGNLLPNFRIQPNSLLQTTGDLLRAGLPPNLQWPGRVETRITLPQHADGAMFESYIFDQRDGFVGQYNLWEVGGLQGQTADCNLPAFSYEPGTAPQQGGFRRSVINFTSDGRCGPNSGVVIHEEVGGAREEIFNGTFGGLVQEALRNPLIKLDLLTCRRLSFPHGNLLEADLLVPNPPFVVENASFDAATLQRTIAFFDRNGNPAPYQNARIEGAPGATVGTPNGTGDLGLTFDLSGLDQALETLIATLLVESPTVLNATAANPLEIPIVIRRGPAPVLLPMLMPELDGPGLIQVGERYKLDITLDPEIAALIQDLECLVGLDNPDDVQVLELPENLFAFNSFDDTTSPEERGRVDDLFGEAFDTDLCINSQRSCFLLIADPGIADMEIFTDGFESGDVSAWSVSCKGSNTEAAPQKNRVVLVEKPFGVLNEDKVLPVITEEELRKAIELFNEDVMFDEKSIGLVSDRFPIDTPLPPIRGTYFFDEFESFRKNGQDSHPVLDGSLCAAPCSGLVFEADGGGVSNLRFEDFPSHAIDIRCDSLWIASNEFAGNAGGGLLITGNNNFVADSLVRANVFEGNGGPAITVLRGMGNRLTYNTFASGGALPIDLGNDGRTENDDGDRDTGPNDLQNFPVLTNVMTGSTVVQGMLNSTPSSGFTLQFYAGDDVLLRFLGEAEVRTDANGDAAFDITLDGTAETGELVYATATNADGSTSEFSRPFEVVGVAAEDGPVLPTRFALFQNYPNPFNPTTTIRYDVPRAGAVRLEVIDLAGRQVALLVDDVLPAGQHTATFGPRNLPSGVYLYRLSGEGFETTKKLLLLK